MNTLKTIAYTASLLLSTLCLPAQAMMHPWFEQSQPQTTYSLDINALSQFYNTRTHYLWLDNQQQTNRTFDAIDFIAGSARHGLQPNNYHYTELSLLDPEQDSLTAQKFDVLLTDGLLKLIHDIKVGRLDANKVDPEWFIPQSSFDAVTFLQQALVASQLKTSLESLLPRSPEYQTLTQALARYQSYVDRGGWPKIAKSPTIRLGDSHPTVPYIWARLAFEEGFTTRNYSIHYDSLLEESVRRFQKKYGLKVDGIIGKGTREQMNISASDRLQQIKVALERLRWMPSDLGQRHLMVNLASYTLQAVEDGNEMLVMKIIAGRESRQTPSFASQMNRVVINPYWNVPRKLAVEDLLPKQQDNFNYFYNHDIRVFLRENGRKIEQDPYLIDWHALNKNNFPYFLRQDPGEHNALGRIKFLFPNEWAIYLHDTNHKNLFKKTMRSISSGCIRVEDPIALANFSLTNQFKQKTLLELIDSNENQGRKVTKPLSIYAVYVTVWVENNEVKFSPDVYQRDKQIADNL